MKITQQQAIQALVQCLPIPKNITDIGLHNENAVYFTWQRGRFKLELNGIAVWQVDGSALAGSNAALLVEQLVKNQLFYNKIAKEFGETIIPKDNIRQTNFTPENGNERAALKAKVDFADSKAGESVVGLKLTELQEGGIYVCLLTGKKVLVNDLSIGEAYFPNDNSLPMQDRIKLNCVTGLTNNGNGIGHFKVVDYQLVRHEIG